MKTYVVLTNMGIILWEGFRGGTVVDRLRSLDYVAGLIQTRFQIIIIHSNPFCRSPIGLAVIVA